MSLMNVIIKADIKKILKDCNEDAERDFLGEFGNYRRTVVYEQSLITIEEFDKICEEILAEDD